MYYAPEFIKERCNELLEKGGTVDDWMKKTLDRLNEGIKRDYNMYLRFGVYWWNFKKLLKKYLGTEYGEYTDEKIANLTDYGTDFENCIAASYYVSTVNHEINYHNYYDKNHDLVSYYLIDTDMELLKKK